MTYEEKIMKEFERFSNKFITKLKEENYEYLGLEGDENLDKAYFENQVLRIPYFLMRYYLRRKDLFTYNNYLYLSENGYADLEGVFLKYLSSKYQIEEDECDDEEPIELDTYDYNEDYPYATLMNLISFTFEVELEINNIYDDNGVDVEDEELDTIDETSYIKEVSGVFQYCREYFDMQQITYSYDCVDKEAAELVESLIYKTLKETNFKESILSIALEHKKELD